MPPQRLLRCPKGVLWGCFSASLGAECMGALRILPPGVAAPATSLRAVTREELSQRIRERPAPPFLSGGRQGTTCRIPGHQAKVALFVRGEEWFLGRGNSRIHVAIPFRWSRWRRSSPA